MKDILVEIFEITGICTWFIILLIVISVLILRKQRKVD